MKRLFILLILLTLLAVPSMADSSTTTTVSNVNSYSVVPPAGIVIYEIVVGPVNMGTNQTHTMWYKGNPYVLNIATYDQWGWKNADVSVTYPNGTTISQHLSALAGITDQYTLTIQPSFLKSEAANLAVTISVGVSPMTANIGALAFSTVSSTSLPFSTASGSLSNGQRADVNIYEISESDFTKTITNYNSINGIAGLASQVFQWAWDRVLGFLNMIPVVGPALITFLDLIGPVIGACIFWLSFVVLNFPAILLSVEIIIILMAIVNSGNGKASFSRLARNLVNYNVMFIGGLMAIIDFVRVMLVSLVELIASIVQALKPI